MKDNIFNITEKLLKNNSKYCSKDDKLLKNQVLEDAQKMDADLLELLLSNDSLKEVFFKKVKDIYVFDKIKFSWVLNNKNFLPDSYTRYQNKIGFGNSSGNYLSSSNDIQLLFPYKDCVLEGGQTKEDQKKDEVFYNELLAPEQVANLLAPKAFANVKKYDKDGIHDVSEFTNKDNLVIKGNNLLALSSLLNKYEGEIKCICIDPPYNTGNDSFGYNDTFNHSTWLTFMKNRLEIAYKLLKEDGSIAIYVDNNELGYLQVLLDEVFGENNKGSIITVKRGSVTGHKSINPGVVNVVEYILIYAKNKKLWNPPKVYRARGRNERYNNFILNRKLDIKEWKFCSLLDAFADAQKVDKKALKKNLGSNYEKELWKFIVANADSVIQFAYPDEDKVSKETKELIENSKKDPENVYFQKRDTEADIYVKNGQRLLFYADRLQTIDGELTTVEQISDFWDDVLPNDLASEGSIKFKKGKKPEKAIKRIIELLAPNSDDIILDFHLGSGTTAAVAHKMQRQYIGVEQMNYGENDSIVRLQNVINGDSSGISKSVNWQGGGSFIYCELAKLNQKYVDKINECKTDTEITKIIRDISESDFVSTKVNPKDINTDIKEYSELTFDEKKRLAMELLDKNQLYVNKTERNDPNMNLSENDIAFTNSFYGDK